MLPGPVYFCSNFCVLPLISSTRRSSLLRTLAKENTGRSAHALHGKSPMSGGQEVTFQGRRLLGNGTGDDISATGGCPVTNSPSLLELAVSMNRSGEERGVAAYERHVSRNSCLHHYLKVGLEFGETRPGFRLNAAHFKQLIVLALKDLHGEFGAALPVDVLRFEEETLTAILRVKSSGLVKLWSALTLLGSYQNQKCAFTVMQVSPFLLALSSDSREFVLN
ncbi:ribonuclease P protein subunit p14 [Stegostoma tigrinum]|uniref:ribonuclease P protein subunit p14 n=1 Tax=Stegostoma tigrinum TaxID=3053191 RepID=UPI00286FD367|nr:ribonuclease P protein subunit p14 [Stegostoma tigrinum]